MQGQDKAYRGKLPRDFYIFSTKGEHGNDKVENGV